MDGVVLASADTPPPTTQPLVVAELPSKKKGDDFGGQLGLPSKNSFIQKKGWIEYRPRESKKHGKVRYATRVKWVATGTGWKKQYKGRVKSIAPIRSEEEYLERKRQDRLAKEIRKRGGGVDFFGGHETRRSIMG